MAIVQLLQRQKTRSSQTSIKAYRKVYKLVKLCCELLFKILQKRIIWEQKRIKINRKACHQGGL